MNHEHARQWSFLSGHGGLVSNNLPRDSPSRLRALASNGDGETPPFSQLSQRLPLGETPTPQKRMALGTTRVVAFAL